MRILSTFLLLLIALPPAAIADGEDGPAAEVETLARSTSSWDGARLPDYPRGRPEVTILRIRVPAGTRLPLHHHPVINAGVLLEGELTVVGSEGSTLHLQAGDAIIEMVDTPHYGMNQGSADAVIIVFYAGVEEKPITVTEP
jgi:quercetin dioxygenase-like cupin family protein